MSRFRVEVVEVVPRRHPDADTLSVVEVWGYTCVVRTAEFPDGVAALAAYIPPDSLVPVARPELAFLKERANAAGLARIKVTRLRGVVSQGLLIPAPAGARLGDDVAELLGVTHYEPPLPLSTGGDDEPAPPGFHPRYDVEHWRRYRHLLVPGEPVLVTEKIHGANARYVYTDGRMWASGHSSWKRYEPVHNIYWRALEADPEVRAFCEANPDVTLYAEVYGNVQDLKYGARRNEVRIVVYDVLRANRWLGALEARELLAGLPQVPVIFQGDYEPATIAELAEGPSQLPGADHVREGVVVKPLVERTDPELGRMCLKIIGDGYLSRRS